MGCGLKFELFDTCRHSALTEHTCLQKQSPTQVTNARGRLQHNTQQTPLTKASPCNIPRGLPLMLVVAQPTDLS